jgi:hypothetical protein
LQLEEFMKAFEEAFDLFSSCVALQYLAFTIAVGSPAEGSYHAGRAVSKGCDCGSSLVTRRIALPASSFPSTASANQKSRE